MRRDIWRQFDFWLYGSVLLLSIFGVVMIRSAIAGNEVLTPLINRQMLYVGIGAVVILIIAAIDYHYWASLTRLMYVFAVASLLIIFIVGQATFGAARWLDVGVFGIQPSELAKIIIVLVLADYFSSTREKERNIRWIATSLLLTLGIVVWIILQPDLSTSIVIMVIWFALLWLSGLPPRYLIVFGVLGLIAAAVGFPFLEDYQQQRVITFAFPDPEARYGNTYNVDQALISIGSGGLFGQGYGHGSQVQLRFLKVRHTDFIFSAMAEEFGFVGTTLVLLLLCFVLIRCLRAVRLAPDLYGSLIAFGFAVIIFFQMIVNVGVNLNVIPVTGLTLPFISYGGSSLLSLSLGIGLVESVALRRKSLDV
jgi:rod shape determining protein RodA